jgi:hypothetical protein
MQYYVLEPEVPGGLGIRTEFDRSVSPPKVTYLHYQFDGWQGDDLITSFPCYLVTERLKHALEYGVATGVSFRDAEVTKSDTFMELYRARELPRFWWTIFEGKPGVDDFASGPNGRPLVSHRVMPILRRFNLASCLIEEYAV